MKVHVVIEVVYGNEGCPDVRAFANEADAIEHEKNLNEENGEDNEDVLVIRESVEVEG